MGCVYVVTNTSTGMQYVGKTKGPLAARKKQHLCETRHVCYFHKAIKKYGKQNFKWEELYVSADEEDLYSKETFFIEKLNTRIPNGYNMTLGGDGLRGVIFSDEWRVKNKERADKLSKAVYCLETNKVYKSRAEAARELGLGYSSVSHCVAGTIRHTEGKHFCDAKDMEYFKTHCDISLDGTKPSLSKEHKAQLSVLLKGKKKPASYSEKLSARMKAQMASYSEEELKARMSKISKGKMKGEDNPSARAVICMDTQTMYVTMKDAVAKLGLPPKAGSNISSCCSGKLWTAYGYHWKYAEEKATI